MIRKAAALAACLIAAPACAQQEETAEAPAEAANAPALYEAVLIDNDFREAGRISLAQGPGELVIRITAEGLSEEHRAAWHGAHLHAIGSCASSDFTSSGGHINPDGRPHGLLNPEGPDNADLPNLWVHADGVLAAEVATTRVRLDEARPGAPSLLDEDGSALVVHALPDDQVSQPIGGAGPRILCAEIVRD